MSLLLDALKRAEDAKRAKAEAAATQATPTESAAEVAAAGHSDSAPALPEALALVDDVGLTPVEPKSDASEAAPPAEFPVLSLEIVDDRPDDPVAKSASNPASPSLAVEEMSKANETPLRTAAAPTRMRLEDMLASELGYSDLDKLAAPISAPTPPATAAFRASRLPAAQRPAELLDSYGTAPSLEPLTALKSGTGPASMPEAESAQQALNREAIRNAFAVKQAATSSGKAKWALPIAGILLVVIGAGGWYVWSEMNRLNKPAARLPVSPSVNAPETSAAAPSTPTAAVATAASSPASASETAVAPEEAPLPPLLPPPATQLKEERAPTATKLVASTPREALARQIKALTASHDPNVGADQVVLRPAKPTALEINPALGAGYAALAVGDYVTAKQRYAEAIAANGNSADAHLGFATAVARSGNAADVPLAIKHYQRTLEIDPRNATASAALIVLADSKDSNVPGGSSSTAEKEIGLKRLIAQDPNAANAYFLLGNLYAESRQWREAQPAYFEAARLMPQNADYNYNLAVSLDQLGQGPAAMSFYRRALAANVTGQFDRAAVERRVSALSSMSAEGLSKRQP
ncbi:MAG: tetratricopeptide repeat protein [Burkholderiales bacterium]